jgi:hypothetical protein
MWTATREERPKIPHAKAACGAPGGSGSRFKRRAWGVAWLFVAGAGAAAEFAVAARGGGFFAAAGKSAGFAEVGGHPAAGAEHALEQGGEIKVGVEGGEVKAVALG